MFSHIHSHATVCNVSLCDTERMNVRAQAHMAEQREHKSPAVVVKGIWTDISGSQVGFRSPDWDVSVLCLQVGFTDIPHFATAK